MNSASEMGELESIDYSKQYDGLISLNCLYMAMKSEVAVDNIMRLLKPGGLAILDFTSHAYWYVSEDSDHWMTINPLQVTNLVRPYLEKLSDRADWKFVRGLRRLLCAKRKDSIGFHEAAC